MTIANKENINFGQTQPYSIDELSVFIIQFDEQDQVDFIFDTIDYNRVQDFRPTDYDTFIDLMHDLGAKSRSGVLYVLEYNQGELILTQDFHDSLKIKYKIDADELARALGYITEENDFIFLERMLIPVDSMAKVKTQLISNNGLPTLEDYLQQYGTEIKRVYYPGAGMDFSPLHLFGRFIKDVDLYFSDYISIPELHATLRRLENSVRTNILTPQDFNKESWEDFWPTNIDRAEMMGHEPSEAWGRKFEFHTKKLDCTLTYMGTEGVQTARVLCENQLAPEVLVLQDHGGCTNYALFGGENSFLHQAMKNCLPKYILMDPTGAEDTKIWPGYEQVTQAYMPKAYESLPQNRKPRALFKKMND